MRPIFMFETDTSFIFPLRFELSLTIDRRPLHVSGSITLGIVFLALGFERKEKTNAA